MGQSAGREFTQERIKDFGAALDFDEDFLSPWHGGEDLGDRRDAEAFVFVAVPRAEGVINGLGLNTAHIELSQLLQGGVGDGELPPGEALRVLVVKTNDVPVLGQLEVGFDAIGTLLPGQLECGQGVFWSLCGRPPVGNDHRMRSGCCMGNGRLLGDWL